MTAAGDGAVLIEAAVRITEQDGTATTVMLSNAEPGNPFGGQDLSYDEAADLTARIADAVQHTEELIAKAYVGRAWKALGLPSWNAWVEERFGNRPVLTVSKSERLQAVMKLAGAGMSNASIGRAIGVDKATVRRDLRALEDAGVANATPDAVVGADGRSYPRPSNSKQADSVSEPCALCGETGHLTDDCPETYVVDDSPIVSRDEWVTDETVFGLGTTTVGGETERRSENVVEGLDDDGDDVDSETEPGPFGSFLPSDVAHQRIGRLVSGADRLTVARDDLEELGPIIGSMRSEIEGWPDPTVMWPSDLAPSVRSQLAGIRAVFENLTEILRQGDVLVGLLERGATGDR